MTLLVLGGTGTLGRQVVIRALNQGFQVKCLVRSLRKSAFLRDCGAEIIYGDLSIPETVPLALLGVTSIIDCSTTRADDSSDTKLVDLQAKYILIEAAIKAKVKRFVFFSIINAKSYENIALVKLKLMVELRLKKSNISYTVFYLPGFFQGLIPQYALPILDQQAVWITSEASSISYINTQDIATMVIQSLSIKQFNNKSVPLVGNRSWKSNDIIELCERLSGRRAKTNRISIYLLSFFKQFVKSFQWSWNIVERLDFTQVLLQNYNTNVNIEEVLYILRMQKSDLEPLEVYLQEYFTRVMKKLKELNYQSLTADNNIDQLKF